MESLAKVREGYDRWAMDYDDDQNPLQTLESTFGATCLQ